MSEKTERTTQMNEEQKIKMIPTWLGEPFYPAGFPMRPQDHSIEDRSIFQIATGDNPTSEEVEWVKDWIEYYMAAPVFDSELTRERLDVIRAGRDHMSISDMLCACFEIGQDPF